MTDLMTDTDRYEELAAASRRVIGSWTTSDLAPAVNELRETLEAHGHADHDEDCITLCPVDPQSDKCRVFHGCWCSEHTEIGAHPE